METQHENLFKEEVSQLSEDYSKKQERDKNKEISLRSDYVLSLLLASISMGLGAPNVIDLNYIEHNHADEFDDIKTEMINEYAKHGISIEGYNDATIHNAYSSVIKKAYDYYRSIGPASPAWKIALELKDIALEMREVSYLISYYFLVNDRDYNGKVSLP